MVTLDETERIGIKKEKVQKNLNALQATLGVIVIDHYHHFMIPMTSCTVSSPFRLLLNLVQLTTVHKMLDV